MRTLTKFFTLLLCFELIVGPINPQLSLLGQEAFAQSCGTGMQWNSTLNRCVTTAQAAHIMNATASCAPEDVNCFRANAESAFQEKVNKGEAPKRKKDNGFISTVTNIAAVAGPVTIAMMALGSSPTLCLSTSHYAMIAGALAVVVGDNMANLKHKKNLSKIRDDWGKIVNPEQANGDKDKEREANIEAQSEAFEMLARAEDSLAESAKTKKNLFTIATIAYGVAAGISTYEFVTENALRAAAKTAAANAVTACEAAAAAAAAAPLAVPALTAAATTSGTIAAPVAATLEDITVASAATASAEAVTAVTSATAGLAAATASSLTPPLAAASITAVKACEAATVATKTATAKLLAAKKKYTCPAAAAGASIENEKKSLYAYYSTNDTFSLKEQIQFRYNIAHSKDLASLFMNQKEMSGALVNPLEDYEVLQSDIAKVEINDESDDSILEVFKKSSLAVLDHLNPLPMAIAEENTQQVNTNGAAAFREEKGKGINWFNLGAGAIAGIVAAKTAAAKYMILPKGRIWYSGVLTGMTLIMANHAGSQAKASEKRAKLLREMKAEFASAAGAIYACRSEDRTDPGKPNCFCYTPENKRNPNRSNSAVCQKFWSGKDLTATNYLSKNSGNSKICINKQGKPDPTCACKQAKNCMKATVNGISGINPGTFSMMSSALQPLNQVLAGADAASIDSGSLDNHAARISKLNKALENSKNLAAVNKGRKKAEKAIMSGLEKASANVPASSLLGQSNNSNLPSNPGEAAKMLEKELDKKYEPLSIPSSPVALPAPAEPMPELEFGLSEDEAAMQEGQIAEVMQQDLDYGGNDINQGSTANIFEVLSSRYQRSGMRRLFDEKGTTQADKPAESDITQ